VVGVVGFGKQENHHATCRMMGKLNGSYLFLPPISRLATKVRRLCRINPVGPIFRNCEGLPLMESWRTAAWDGVRGKIWRYEGEGKFNAEISLYRFRHTYQVRRGTPTTIIACLCGTSAKMIERVYCHLNEDDLLQFVNGAAVAVAAG
jgi:integrase